MLRAALTAIALIVPSLALAGAERGGDALRATMLLRHNAAREAYGVAPLGWSEVLAADAANYAAELAATGEFGHAEQDAQGENLFMGTRGAYPYADMAQMWIDEREHYRPGRIPYVARTGNFGDVGHYTQIVWPSTTHVGCAFASNADDDYLVCRYSPAGNVVGLAMR